MKGDAISMIVNGFCKEVFRVSSTEFAIDVLRGVADGVNALKGPERTATLATCSRPPARLHRPRPRPRAERRAHPERRAHRDLRRTGTGARTRIERLRVGAGDGGGRGMNGAAASTATARYSGAFARCEATLPGQDSAWPREATFRK